MKTDSILIVDDEPDNFDVIEAILSGQNYLLHYAANGYEAISNIGTFNPDVILLDVMMPGMDGIEVCRKIKAMSEWKGVPIIMVTALNTKEDLAMCLQAGADDFIGKPVNAIELRARVQSMTRIKQQYDNIQSFTALQQNTINLLVNNLQELRGNLALSLPHELNTPLNGILGALNFLMQDLEDMTQEEVHELINLSYQSACRLEKLTRRFLNYLSLEFDTFPLKENQPKLPTVSSETKVMGHSLVLENIGKIVAEEIGRSDDLICDVEAIDLNVSDYHLQWIVRELIENALKFSDPKTPVTLTGRYENGVFQVSIHDRGRGMTPEQIARIGAFIQFERKTYAQQGAGLGLKIAQKVIELYGGKFMVSSIYHQETTVYFELPVAESRPST